jgi:cytochrome c peroxidase
VPFIRPSTPRSRRLAAAAAFVGLAAFVGWLQGSGAAPSAPATGASTPIAPVASTYAPQSQARVPVAQVAALGREMFFDAGLSASGLASCASCHDPHHAYGPANALPVQPGGIRAAPSLRYLQTLPPFSEHHYDNDGNDSIDAGPTGGHTWDGRADSAHDQARLPLLSVNEMANRTPEAVVARLRRASYAPRIRDAFGEAVFDKDDALFKAALMALEVFQQTPSEFYPYSSKYDDVLRGKAQLSPQEARGLALFNDESKGNCASCHLSAISTDGAFPLFTDFGHIALGAPRNAAIPANRDPSHHDLGLCGPLRTDFTHVAAYCGRFRTPTLRNAAVRRSFFHNGVFHSLDEVLRFYARRDTQPSRFYPRDAKGVVRKFDDLPAAYAANVNMDAPFGGQIGGREALTDGEMRDIIAFLKTLTDADTRP